MSFASGVATGAGVVAGVANGINSLADALGIGLGWRSQYQIGSFRGVPFFTRKHDQTFGRRGPQHEFPLRDTPSGEDLGRRGEIYRLTAYFLGDTYLDDANALYQAAAQTPGPGTLIHPYLNSTLGPLTVICRLCKRSEVETRGGEAVIDLTFEEWGTTQSPTATVDTSSGVLDAASDVLGAVSQVYGVAVAVAGTVEFVQAEVTSLIGLAQAAFVGLPGGADASLVDMAEAISATPFDTVATPAAIGAAFDAYADLVTSNPGTYAPGDDLSFGLSGIATGFGASLPVIAQTTPARVQQAANQAAIVATVQASATAAWATVYAQTPAAGYQAPVVPSTTSSSAASGSVAPPPTFVSAQAAEAARTAITTAIDTQAVAASGAGLTALYVALTDLYIAVSADMTQRAMGLPLQVTYAFADTPPALALAWRLYQDPTRAAELVALNDAPHPGFMPASGVALMP